MSDLVLLFAFLPALRPHDQLRSCALVKLVADHFLSSLAIVCHRAALALRGQELAFVAELNVAYA